MSEGTIARTVEDRTAIERWENEGGTTPKARGAVDMRQGAAKRSSSRNRGGYEPARCRDLLVPIDLTASSDRVLGRVALLPLADDARVTLLHVVPGSLPPRERVKAERDAARALAEESRHLRKCLPKHVSVDPVVRHGSAAKEIGACATKTKAELIVVGRGARRALREAFLGSTAERVVRQAQLPVLVVQRPPRSAYGRPALALDIDLAAHEIIRLMLLLLTRPLPRIPVIHAFRVPYESRIYPSLTEHEVDEMKGEFHGKAAHDLTKLLANARAKAKVPPEHAPAWQIHLRHGSPRSVVDRFTRKAQTDLLVLGTHAYSGIAHYFLGTVAGDLLREAKCDVLVVPPAPSRKNHVRNSKK